MCRGGVVVAKSNRLSSSKRPQNSSTLSEGSTAFRGAGAVMLPRLPRRPIMRRPNIIRRSNHLDGTKYTRRSPNQPIQMIIITYQPIMRGASCAMSKSSLCHHRLQTADIISSAKASMSAIETSI